MSIVTQLPNCLYQLEDLKSPLRSIKIILNLIVVRLIIIEERLSLIE